MSYLQDRVSVESDCLALMSFESCSCSDHVLAAVCFVVRIKAFDVDETYQYTKLCEPPYLFTLKPA